MSEVDPKAAPSVCIVLATLNGAAHVDQQIDSFKSQALQPRWLVVSDDGSTDDTLEIIQRACRTWVNCKLFILDGPRLGYAANFFHALSHVPPDADYIALSDQDDVWLHDKLERAVAALTKTETAGARALYGSATWVSSLNLEPRRLSRITKVTPNFNHALAQNFAGGNTMVLSRPAMEVLRHAMEKPLRVEVHDWWIYQLLAGSGASIIYDEEPSLLYRQHQNNLIGDNSGSLAVLRRFRKMLRGTYKSWNSRNFEALLERSHLLTPGAARTLETTMKGRNGNLAARLTLAREGIVMRQSALGRIGLWLSLALNRF